MLSGFTIYTINAWQELKLVVKFKHIFLLFGLISLAGCFSNNATVDEATHNRIAVCSNGSKVTLKGQLQSKLFSLVEKGVSTGGEISTEVKGHFLDIADVSEENAVKLYESYVRCIQGEASTEELLAVERNNFLNTNKALQKSGLVDQSIALQTDYMNYVNAIRKGQRIAEAEANVRYKKTLESAKQQLDSLQSHTPTITKNDFVFQSRTVTLGKPQIFFGGKLVLTALDKRKRSGSCYIRLQAFVDGKTNPPKDLHLLTGKPKLYSYRERQYLIHVIENEQDHSCLLSSYKI